VAQDLEALPEVKGVQVDPGTGRVTFASEQPVSWEELARAVKAAGYELASGPS